MKGNFQIRSGFSSPCFSALQPLVHGHVHQKQQQRIHAVFHGYGVYPYPDYFRRIVHHHRQGGEYAVHQKKGNEMHQIGGPKAPRVAIFEQHVVHGYKQGRQRKGNDRVGAVGKKYGEEHECRKYRLGNFGPRGVSLIRKISFQALINKHDGIRHGEKKHPLLHR